MRERQVIAPLAFTAICHFPCGYVCAREDPPRGSDGFAPFAFVQLGDPQIGFGYDGPEMDRKRLEFLVEKINEARPSFVLVTGDFTQGNKKEEFDAYSKVIEKLLSPRYAVIGNHEVGVPTKPRVLRSYGEQVERCRRKHGDDNVVFTYNNCVFIGVNSQTLCVDETRAKGRTLEEARSTWQWLVSTLEDARKKRRAHITIFMHIPPFVEKEDEKDGYYNLPGEQRKRFLDIVRRYGATRILAGHTHKTQEIRPADEAFTIYTVGGTSRISDDKGHGYRLFNVAEKRVEQRFVSIDGEMDVRPPTEPSGLRAGMKGRSVTLSWKPAQDDNGVFYTVDRDRRYWVGVTRGTSWTDTSAKPGATYRYRLRAWDGFGKKSGPLELRFTVPQKP